MSHVADVDCKFRDLKMAAQAAKALGGELVLGQQTHNWYGRFMNDWQDSRAAVNRRDASTFGKCDHAIKFPGVHYEIGLVKEADGSYTAVYDTYGSGGGHDGRKLEAICGVGLTKLVDEYSAAVAIRQAARNGFKVQRTLDAATGEIVLTARS